MLYSVTVLTYIAILQTAFVSCQLRFEECTIESHSCHSFFNFLPESEWRGICFTVCLFVRSTISRQPAGRITPKFACRRTLVPDVSSPLLGVGGPRRAEKGANEIFVTMGVKGEFLHFGGF